MSLERAYAACEGCYMAYTITTEIGYNHAGTKVMNDSRYEAMGALERVIERPTLGIDFGSVSFDKRDKIVVDVLNPAKEALEKCRTCDHKGMRIVNILDQQFFNKKE